MAAMNSQLSHRPVCSAASDAGSTSIGTSGSENSSSSSNLSSSSSDDGFIQHFNWSTEGQHRDKCVATLVQALLDDPVNQYLSGALPAGLPCWPSQPACLPAPQLVLSSAALHCMHCSEVTHDTDCDMHTAQHAY